MSNYDDPGWLGKHLSEMRLRQYLDHSGGDLERAIALYTWNARLAAALFADLGHLEVALRNALDSRMTTRHERLGRPRTWMDDPTGELGRDLGPGRPRHEQPYKDIATARARVRSNGKPLDHGQILSETSFGLWHQLVSKRWTNFWPDLASAFPHAPDRRRETIADPISDLRDLRNRISHHHRVWSLPVEERYRQILDVLSYIDPEMSKWVAARSLVPALLESSPLRQHGA